MLRNVCKAKIHRATVTAADLNYLGSITIDRALMDAAGILPYEMVQITNCNNGMIWRTYVIAGSYGGGEICLNGPPARHFQPGDQVIILADAYCTDAELKRFVPRVLFVDDRNRLTRVVEGEPPFTEG